MTGREANEQYIGKVFFYPVPQTGLEVEVRVDDWKKSYGNDLLLCIPVAGKGSSWIRPATLREKLHEPAR
jgi:hypothetical protein